jgi:hypothetical protein
MEQRYSIGFAAPEESSATRDHESHDETDDSHDDRRH